jgi:anaerobic selenocysteine-containing dehydrogenase
MSPVAREVRHSACPLDCPDLCHLEVEVEGGRVQRVGGGDRTPITDGFICGKVRNIADHLYGDDRVRHPLIRTGAKGEARFRQATWDEALDVIVGRLRAVASTLGGEAILPYHYGGSNGWLTEGALATRFFRRVGASICNRTLCAAATTAATRGLYGAIPGVALEDYVHARLIVLWGMNPSATGIHLVPIIDKARESGARLVVVDPRRTPLARRADLHLPVRPGADLPVALAIIHALFERGLADEAFLAEHAVDVAELRRRASRWAIADAAAEAGLRAEDLDAFVAMYAAASPAVIRAGWGLERNRNGGSAVAAVLALPAVAGKFGVRGGGFTMSNGDARWGLGPEPGIAEPLPAGRRVVNMSLLGDALSWTGERRIGALFVYNANPAATTPNQNGILAGLARDDLFVVVHEQVMTDTARWADVVLPATTFLEHRDIRRGYGAMRLYDAAAVATPVGEARSNNQLFGELLRRMDLVRPGDPMTDDEIAAAIFGAGADGAEVRRQLDASGVAAPPDGPRPVTFVDVLPATVDRKIHLVPEHLDREADGLYEYLPDPGSDDYPLALVSPALATQISSMFGQLHRREVPIEIHPDDAAARGIADGDEVRVWNALGEVRVACKVSREMRPGVVCLPKGLWRHHTRNGQTANALIPEVTADLGGQAAFNDARVQVARA